MPSIKSCLFVLACVFVVVPGCKVGTTVQGEDSGGPSGGKDTGSPGEDGGACDVTWYCHHLAGACCSDVVQYPICESGTAVCPEGTIPTDDCICGTWDAGKPPLDAGTLDDSGMVNDTGTADDGGTADGGQLTCKVAGDCPGVPPIKCMGAHWECIGGLCEGRCGQECPDACGIECEYGYKVDDKGCPLCECNDPPTCPPLACNIWSEFGFKVDARGCDICSCVEQRPSCGGLAGTQCPQGTHCKMREPVTPDGMGDCFAACDDPNAKCPLGYACQHVDPTLESPLACLPACDPPPCTLFCAWGYRRDDRGCEVCRCAEKPGCPPNDCEIFCQWGFATDVNGCQVCACAVKPGCTSTEVCSIICDDVGWKTGPDGCPLCECNDHTCAEQCSINCPCRQDHFGCDVNQCQSVDTCGGFVAKQCPQGDVCVLPDMPDAQGVCVPQCDPSGQPCKDADCIPVAYHDASVEFGCVPKCETGCDIYCPGGYQKDARGCDQCRCHQCPALGCAQRPCEFGIALDSSGCETCACRDAPVACRKDFPQCRQGTLCDPDTKLCFAECGGKQGIACPEARDWCKPLDPNQTDGMGVCIPTE